MAPEAGAEQKEAPTGEAETPQAGQSDACAQSCGEIAEGRIVRYVSPDGWVRPAIVTRVCDPQTGVVNLTAFPDGTNDVGVEPPGTTFRATSVQYSAEVQAGTWHWPRKD